jgi:hypothetical protein
MIAQQYLHRTNVYNRRRFSRRKLLIWTELLLKGSAFAMIALVMLMSLACCISPSSHKAREIKVTVAQGDTLWKYASIYGSKERYILSSLDEIKRANNITGSEPIQPGTQIVIPQSVAEAR